MNIFVLDRDPQVAAQMHCDTHVVKLILETAQMLSTAHHVYETPQADKVYKKAHPNHPCTKWVCESKANYHWALRLYHALLVEFRKRRNKDHKSGELMQHLANVPKNMPDIGATPFAQAMPDSYKSSCVVTAYRNYYKGEKASIAQWNWGTPMPEWFAVTHDTVEEYIK